MVDSRRLRVTGLAVAVLVASVLSSTVSVVAAQSPECQFVLGFAALRDQLGATIVGQCLEDEQFTPDGDSRQRTTRGLLRWSPVSNQLTFTDGVFTWVETPLEIERYLEVERLPSEAPAVAIEQPTAAPRFVAQGYGAGTGGISGREVGYGVVVENPDPDLAREHVEVVAAFYSREGTLLGIDREPVRILLPGQQLGVGKRVYLSGDGEVARLSVQLHPGAPSPGAPSLLVAENAQHHDSRVSGLVRNTSDREITTALVSAIAYDADGNVIGGGTDRVPVVAANGTSPVALPVVTNGVPARVELHPRLLVFP